MVPAPAEREVWDGLREHSLDGWNLGKVPTGYLAEKHPHPNPVKAAEGRTKTRLIPDPEFAPIVALIYRWRVTEHLGKPTIRKRLADNPHLYSVPPSGAWSIGLVDEILSNPKYTGHQVVGRRRHKGGKRVWTPASEWIWTPEPTHEAIVPKEVWDAAQTMGMRHGSTRDPGTPTRRPGRRYVLRSRLFCSICNRRLSGKARTTTAQILTYYQCPHDPGIRRHAAAYPDHRNVTVREEPVMDALTGFYATRVFGPDRAALLAAITPVTTAAAAARTTARTKTLRKKLAKIDVAETALITELETPADPDDPAAQALRNRIRARFTELYTERTRINTDLAALKAADAEPVDDPTLLDELPLLGNILTGAPDALIERLLALFDLRAVYNRDKHQLTIRASITDGTLQAVNELLNDPRADHNQQPSEPRSIRHDQIAPSTGPTGSSPRTVPSSPPSTIQLRRCDPSWAIR